jgi:hypothetical protein
MISFHIGDFSTEGGINSLISLVIVARSKTIVRCYALNVEVTAEGLKSTRVVLWT